MQLNQSYHAALSYNIVMSHLFLRPHCRESKRREKWVSWTSGYAQLPSPKIYSLWIKRERNKIIVKTEKDENEHQLLARLQDSQSSSVTVTTRIYFIVIRKGSKRAFMWSVRKIIARHQNQNTQCSFSAKKQL